MIKKMYEKDDQADVSIPLVGQGRELVFDDAIRLPPVPFRVLVVFSVSIHISYR